jgi:hypothetical protein
LTKWLKAYAVVSADLGLPIFCRTPRPRCSWSRSRPHARRYRYESDGRGDLRDNPLAPFTSEVARRNPEAKADDEPDDQNEHGSSSTHCAKLLPGRLTASSEVVFTRPIPTANLLVFERCTARPSSTLLSVGIRPLVALAPRANVDLFGPQCWGVVTLVSFSGLRSTESQELGSYEGSLNG